VEVKDYISGVAIIISATIAISGWIYTANQNRQHEIFKRSLDARVQLLEDYLLFFEKANENKSLDGFNKIQVRFYIYGNEDEIKLVKNIALDIEKNKRMTDQAWKNFIQLNTITRDRLRKELGLSKVSI